ncbi:thioesterase [Streptomyces viridosporus ATCC 14672]|uniref:Thioesterase n=1 Tax=Streptomyces viridosporus (strain ATCC 14672 / DSM 40746 / JCM 4963 / KCTC 9882 / NRRL B-12104 / FH 1290) TaxID=566461 RepID=D6A1F8_STRV1|nr:alpha/beta fold hydrolase [Streptomyces viridosporus]EFE65520.1 thioesterase [Streptomyces viridosporus ATCC 14672]
MTTARTRSQSSWLRACNRVTRPRSRLVCAPHAGGTAHAYRSWPAALPDDVEVLAVQYPGRQDRLAEPPAGTMDDLVRPIADALAPFVGEPLALFGHSMGASVAYEVTLELERRHGRVVDLLTVSGSCAPHRREEEDRHELDDAELVEELRRLDDSFDDLLAVPELLDLVLPSIRADFRLVSLYRRTPAVPVRAPLLVFGGTGDPDVSPEELREWHACAGGDFDTRTFPGDHFYLTDERPVLEALAPRLPGPRPPGPHVP